MLEGNMGVLKQPSDWHHNLMRVLTPAQFRVTILVASGLKNTEIARVVNTTVGVVKNLLNEIFLRSDTANRVELALRYTHELEKGVYDHRRLSRELGQVESLVGRLHKRRSRKQIPSQR
jgi:DNA-binding CsgD family transcriptional regulator